MNTVTLLQQQLGPLCLPLFLCSLLTAVILLERFIVLSVKTIQRSLKQQALLLLQQHSGASKSLREEIASVWLQSQRHKLASGIRILQITALLSPLLGLLGTVMGLIQVFDVVGENSGPIEPSLLAAGLGIAMKTTVAGLVIALPATLGAHSFQLWVDKLVVATEHALNIHSLQIDGVCTEALH